MRSRRDFLKTAATGAVLLGSQVKPGLAAMVDASGLHPQHADAVKSRVVVAHDGALHGPDGQLSERHVIELLDRAIAAYTERDNPVDAWKRIVPVGKTIGL